MPKNLVGDRVSKVVLVEKNYKEREAISKEVISLFLEALEGEEINLTLEALLKYTSIEKVGREIASLILGEDIRDA